MEGPKLLDGSFFFVPACCMFLCVSGSGNMLRGAGTNWIDEAKMCQWTTSANGNQVNGERKMVFSICHPGIQYERQNTQFTLPNVCICECGAYSLRCCFVSKKYECQRVDAWIRWPRYRCYIFLCAISVLRNGEQNKMLFEEIFVRDEKIERWLCEVMAFLFIRYTQYFIFSCQWLLILLLNQMRWCRW